MAGLHPVNFVFHYQEGTMLQPTVVPMFYSKKDLRSDVHMELRLESDWHFFLSQVGG